MTEPSDLELEVARPTKWDDEAAMWPHIEQALEHFGTPTSEVLYGSQDWKTGELHKGGRYSWKRSRSQFEGDIAYLVAGEPWPKTAMGMISLRFTQSFKWKQSPALPSLARAHPGSPRGGGAFTIWLSRKCFVQPDLSIPFAHDEPAILDFLSELQVHLPFRMHNNHFRRQVPGKTPETGKVRKMPFPVLLG
ncbi:MAG: hypothetical protein V4617_01670 [Gemmatimonadota bacterium]